MKHIFTLLILLGLSSVSFAQQTEKCARVQIWNVDQKTLADKGIAFIHGQFTPERIFTGEICGQDIETLKTSGLKYETLIADITDFYVKRNLEKKTEPPKDIEYNCGSPKSYTSPAHFSLGSMGGFYTFDETMAELDTMRALYPQLISQKMQIGSSIEGRPIVCMRISNNPDTEQAKPQVLFTALHHAMENMGKQQLIYFMWYLLENYNTDPEIKYMVDHLEIYFVPVVNPDGDVFNQTSNPNGGGTWRKNRRPNGIWTGVDINRNYSYAFAYDNIGSSNLGAHPWYRGDSAFSEPESQAMRSLIVSKHFSLELNWHSYSDYLIYPWNYDGSHTADSVYYEQLGRYVCLESHFRYGTCNQTYGYNSNGDADDFAYGDTTKNKIISLTAEIGSSTDGFWPQSSNIEALCKQSLDIDLRYIRLATPFALVNDLAPTFISTLQNKVPVEVYCIGRDVPASFTVSITGISPWIIATGPPVQFDSMTILEKRYDSLSYTLDPTIPQGTPYNYAINISNGDYTWTDTITKIFCSPDTLLFDPADNMNNWTSSGYSVTTDQFTSAPSSFTESPNGNYSLLQSSSMELANPIDLTDYNEAYLQFSAKWDIEIAYDYVQVLASIDNGATWIPLCGKYSFYGSSSQQPGQPVYDGFVKNWVKEEIPLIYFTGNPLKLKFTFNSNLTNQYNGMYIDDIRVLAYKNTTGIHEHDAVNSALITVFPNPANDAVNIAVLGNNGKTISIQLTDVCGKLLYSKSLINSPGTTMITTYALPDGIYFLNATSSSGGKQNIKISVIH